MICGSAQGVSMTANKYKKIRAAVCSEPEIGTLARKYNEANILCLPARYLSEKKPVTLNLTFYKPHLKVAGTKGVLKNKIKFVRNLASELPFLC